MKRLLVLLLVSYIFLCSTGCHHKIEKIPLATNNSTLDISSDVSSSDIEQSNIERILNRKIFILKESTPTIYTSIVRDIDTTNAYKENWSYKEILNKKNFTDIKWESRNVNDGVHLTFKGESKQSQGLVISIDFIIQNKENTSPLAWSFRSSDGAVIDVESMQLAGVEGFSAFSFTDATISTLIIALSKENNLSVNTEDLNDWDFNDFNPIPFSMEEFCSYSKDPNWYDNGIFSTYMEKEYPNDSWEYAGTFNCNMNINPYGYTGFQVYLHQCEEAQRVYTYLVPISPVGVPEVYAFDEISETMKLVFCGTQ